MNRYWRGVGCLGLLLLVACGRQAELPPPTVHLPTLPAAWSAPALTAEPAAWLTSIGDPGLIAAVSEAWAANPELAALAARLRQAEARRRQSGAERLPSLDATAGANRSRSNPVNPVTGDPVPNYATTLEAGLRLSWELDAWGRLRALSRAAVLDEAAAREEFAAGRLSLATQVARRRLVLAEATAQVALAERIVVVGQAAMQAVEARYAGGSASAGDVHLARSEMASAEADLAARHRARDAAARAAQVVLGRYPDAELASPTLPAPPTAPTAGLPADLLLRRSDLRAAAARYHAAMARAGAARADLLPRISLSASAGTRSDELADLVSSERLVWNLAANLLAPLFDGGRRRAVANQREAEAEEAANRFAAAALTALREVESGLAAGPLLRERLDAQQRAATAAEAAARDIANRFAAGDSDALTLLAATRRAAQAAALALSAQREVMDNHLDLVLALGGPAE